RVRILQAAVRGTRASAARQAGRAADVLVLRLVLVGLGVVGDVGRRGRVRVLRRGARTGVDVAARNRHGHVRVHCVLVALRGADGDLRRVRILQAGLIGTRASATRQAGRAADVLVLRLVLVGLGMVGDVGRRG